MFFEAKKRALLIFDHEVEEEEIGDICEELVDFTDDFQIAIGLADTMDQWENDRNDIGYIFFGEGCLENSDYLILIEDVLERAISGHKVNLFALYDNEGTNPLDPVMAEMAQKDKFKNVLFVDVDNSPCGFPIFSLN